MNEFMNIIKILDYFFIYSFLGWVIESIYKTIGARKFVNSGFLYGPFCPIYGLGALIMYLFLSGYNENPLHVFIIGFVVLSIWEYVVAWAIEKTFHEKYWDYSDNKFNINGRVCLLNSIFWGALGVIFTYIVHPFVQDAIKQIDNKALIAMAIILTVSMTIDIIVSTIRLQNISKKLEDIKRIRNEITEKLKELKNSNNKSNRKETIQLLINDLKTQESILKMKLMRQTIRIRRAFPSMKSEKFKQITKYLRK